MNQRIQDDDDDGVRVHRVRLERGGHVQHLLTNPELYAKTLTAALDAGP